MLKVLTFITGPLQVCTYLVYCDQSKEAALIDPGDADSEILKILEEYELKPKFILGTHGHPDHILGVEYFRQGLKVPFFLHQQDEIFFQDPKNFIEFKSWGFPPNPRADAVFTDGTRFTLGEEELHVLHTPGHSPGSSCFYSPKASIIFTGDTLFVGAVGRADLPGGNFSQMLNSIQEKLLTLPDHTVVYPGHDYGPKPTSTIGEERRFNPYLS